MTQLVNRDEIFAIAISIENNAVLFYKRAASLQGENREGIRAVLEGLASVEERHRQIIEAMRSALPKAPDGQRETVDMEGGLFLSAITSGYKLEGSPSVAEKLTGRESPLDILKQGMELEKQSILFYLGLRDVLSSKTDRESIDSIIKEEKAHLTVLAEQVHMFAST